MYGKLVDCATLRRMGTGTTGAGGVTIAWERTGSGPPVVLVHGITESRGTWAPIVDRLASDREVVTVDLRGHGDSSAGPSYELGDLAADVHAVIADLDLDRPDVVGHSLGGAVVSGLGAFGGVRSVVNVDQSLALSAFQDQVRSVEPMLRDAAAFPMVIAGLFDQLAGPLSVAERERVGALRRPDQQVVLGVWRVLLEADAADVDAAIDAALAGYAANPVPYLSIMGVDPGPDYAGWIEARIPGAVTEVWADHGHYPHLVDPDRFVNRLHEFWSA